MTDEGFAWAISEGTSQGKVRNGLEQAGLTGAICTGNDRQAVIERLEPRRREVAEVAQLDPGNCGQETRTGIRR
jgi:hypothetical protein